MNALIRETDATAAIPPMCPTCYRKPCVCGNMLAPKSELGPRLAKVDPAKAPKCARCGQVYASCTCPKWLGVTDWDAELSALCPRCLNPAGSCTCGRTAQSHL